jgi:urease accessory protein
MAAITPMVIRMFIDTTMRTESHGLALVRLMQLISPTLPIGAFTYSQGLEYAIECGWVSDVESLEDWLSGLMQDGLSRLEVPLLKRACQACRDRDLQSLNKWGEYLLASRETSELRQEEINRARALTVLLQGLGVSYANEWQKVLKKSQLSAFALAATSWHISTEEAALGYVWGWLENQVAAGIKLVPLGQTDGQRVQMRLAESIPALVAEGLSLHDDEIGASAPAMAIASSLHETQYTRLFRS